MSEHNEIIRTLYRGAIDWPLVHFQKAALDTVSEWIAFDSAMWARGGEPPEAIVDVYLDRQPQAMIEEYLHDYQQYDFLADAVRAQPGKTVKLTDLSSRADFEASRVYPFAKKWGVQQVLSTCWLEPVSGLIGVLSLWRKSPKKPFTEAERSGVESLVPHLAEAHRICRITYMRRANTNTHLQSHAIALCNSRGALIEVEPGFYELIQQEWTDWQGMTLPRALLPTITRQKAFKGRSVVVTASPLGNMVRIVIRPSSVLDGLGKRQMDIALRYARGENYRDIAQALNLAESTVRNHIAHIFNKCQVNNKIRLAQLIQKYAISSKQ
jgi:DNA-binding CsgD family transcriptional regulator